MMNFSDNPDFYPTPKSLIQKMLDKVDSLSNCMEILEPSAGAGHIVEYMNEEFYHSRFRISCIEKDPRLQKMLLGANRRLIDTDFLTYSGGEQFDLIVANFPFSNGEHHLLKAIDVIYSGQIVCLVNAQTLKNPNTNYKKQLVIELERLNADIEFLQGEFESAERKTKVECALVYIDKRIDIEEDLFKGMKEEKSESQEEVKNFDLTQEASISSLVTLFEKEKELVVNQLLDFYKNYNLISPHLSLEVSGDDSYYRDEDLTSIMKKKINAVTRKIKKDYWKRTLDLKEVKRYLSSGKKKLVESQIEQFCEMEFTESNIRQFILNLVQEFPSMVEDAIEYLFDEFTRYALKDSNWGEEYKKCIHYFNGWKSNHAFKISNKVIRPFYRNRYSFDDKLELGYDEREFFNDIDIVLSYFTGEVPRFETYDLVQNALKEGQNRKIETPYFEISVFKKGTVHFKFKSDDLLRRFNIEACRLKKWLPMDYGHRSYGNLNEEEKSVVEQFEGKKEYKIIPGGAGLIDAIKGQIPLMIAMEA